MIGRDNSRMNRRKDKLKSSAGMTLAEVLITVAIIVVLMGVSFIALFKYQRSLGQLERDNVAKEIFIAAQNHLTMAKGEEYYDSESGDALNYGNPEEGSQGVYYFVINSDNRSELDNKDSLISMMLPFGSIDDTVRRGGSYIVRYQPATATVLDVFYTSESGSPGAFNHKLTASEYTAIMQKTGDEKKDARENVNGEGWILGWYGGTDPSSLAEGGAGRTLTLEVTNAETLYVTVKDIDAKYKYMLIIEGLTSHALKEVPLSGDRWTTEGTAGKFVLDDIFAENRHFYDLIKDVSGDKKFIPGENISLRAYSYSETSKDDFAYSGTEITNSLYGSLSEHKDGNNMIYKATVGYLRHLENLEEDISHTGFCNGDLVSKKKITLATAYQTGHIDASATSTSSVYKWADNSKVQGFYPVSYNEPLLYDGCGNSVSDINVKSVVTIGNTSYGGMFGFVQGNSKIKNLELKDVKISATGITYAGALAGYTSNTNINNVVAYNSDGKDSEDDATINGTEAGGLIGCASGGNIMYSAAALVVSGSTDAGGLIGKTEGKTVVRACYSGGHTDKGEYYKHRSNSNTRIRELYNVTAGSGGAAGGLIGKASSYSSGGGSNTSTTVNNCYSTCSATAAGNGNNNIGGLIGNAYGKVTVNFSYSTGLVSGDYAFIGKGSASGLGNSYYQAINEKTDEAGKFSGEYKAPVSGEEPSVVFISPFDEMLNSTDQRSGILLGNPSKWRDAEPYDTFVRTHYKYDSATKYSLEGVTQLSAAHPESTEYGQHDAIGTDYFVNTHYGDWPAPELFIINTN